jgi:hypothetical protein
MRTFFLINTHPRKAEATRLAALAPLGLPQGAACPPRGASAKTGFKTPLVAEDPPEPTVEEAKMESERLAEEAKKGAAPPARLAESPEEADKEETRLAEVATDGSGPTEDGGSPSSTKRKGKAKFATAQTVGTDGTLEPGEKRQKVLAGGPEAEGDADAAKAQAAKRALKILSTKANKPEKPPKRARTAGAS